MKVVAMYLPQFHRVKENDEWWGEGFTDWVSTRQAVPLFDGHQQPHIPLNNNYYDLLEKETMEWQADLMHQYGIDGMCMYHYWFKDGRQILEKPAENLLQWKDINMPFCFCWANQTWARSWSNVKTKNPWADIFEKDEKKENSGVLLLQEYGREEQWKKHFDYLLPFFKDERYIKVEDKPLFILYQVADICCVQEMIAYWRRLAEENGLKGLYILGAACGDYKIKELDAELCLQPSRARKELKKEDGKFLHKLDYDKVWETVLSYQKEGKIYYEGFVSYDDTPRRGKAGLRIEGMTSEKFQKYIAMLIAKNATVNNDMTFINAWNEWGEGMYLEPDTENEYQLLEAVKFAKSHYKEFENEYKNLLITKSGLEVKTENMNGTKSDYYLNLLDLWLEKEEKKNYIKEWFIKNNIKRFAIYGYGVLGKHLLNQVQNSEIEVSYIIDKNKKNIFIDVPVYTLEDTLPFCEVVIVSATYYYDEIYHELKNKGVSKIISLEQIIQEC